MAVLRGRFGERYEESYEHGKRVFRDALAAHLDLPAGAAAHLVDELEEAQAIRFHRAAPRQEVEGPRVGLFDEPRTIPAGEPAPESAGQYWQIGQDAVVPGGLSDAV